MPNIELKNTKTEDLIFDDSKKQNSRGETILGTFEGPCADIVDGTRNGRHYSEELWQKVFNDPIVKELFECGGILGELDHPSDREETKTSEVAICMSEPPTKGSDGLLYGKWDVLDTPNGRIAATLAKYGYKFGISSRGSGDTYTGPNGNEEVDPDSYDFQAFDLVILPAVKKARLTFSEGLERNTLGKALTESLNKANPDERLIMENTLKRLNIKLNESLKPNGGDNKNYWMFYVGPGYPTWDEIKQFGKENGCSTIWWGSDTASGYKGTYNGDTAIVCKDVSELPDGYKEDAIKHGESIIQSNQVIDNIDEGMKNSSVDNTEEHILSELQESLQANQKLQNKIIELQEKLSACYTRESDQEDEIAKYKNVISKLTLSVNRVKGLEEKLDNVNNKLTLCEATLSKKDKIITKLTNDISSIDASRKSLTESVNDNANKLKVLTEKYSTVIESKNKEIESLHENLAELQKDTELKKSDYNNKLDKANKLVERYKKIAKKAVNKYIESQSVKLGVSINEIKNKLPSSYTFEDIDKICEDLQDYKLSINKLPFRTLTENYNMKVTSPKSDLPIPANKFDDDIDDGLMSLAGLQ